MLDRISHLKCSWPFAPERIDLNRDTGLIKLVAMVTMFVDHSGKMLFPQWPLMRIIGRIAFPLYCYCIAVGCVYTRDPLKYLRRIVLLALISQPIYAVAMAHTTKAMYSISFAERPFTAALNFYLNSWYHPGVLVTLTLGVMIIWTIRNRQLILTAALFLLCWKIRGSIDYGMDGIVLIVLFYLFCWKWWASLPIVLGFMILWGSKGSAYSLARWFEGVNIRYGIQMYTVFALPFVYIRTRSGLKLPKWLSYGFYPAHLVLILLLDKLVFA